MCALDSGVFVAVDKLTPFEDSDSKVHVPVRHRVNIERKVNIVRHEVNIDERVVTFAGDAPVRGTVGYIGEDKDSNGQIHTIVALELACLTVSCHMYVYNRLLMPIVQYSPLKVNYSTYM